MTRVQTCALPISQTGSHNRGRGKTDRESKGNSTMTREEVLKNLNEKFKNDIIEVRDRSPKRVYVEIKPGAIVSMGNYLFKDLGARKSVA